MIRGIGATADGIIMIPLYVARIIRRFMREGILIGISLPPTIHIIPGVRMRMVGNGTERHATSARQEEVVWCAEEREMMAGIDRLEGQAA